MKKITFSKYFTFLIALFGALNFGFGQTTLSAGDIVITGFNSDDPDEFTFVLLTDVSNTTSIKFTDNGWQSSGSFRSNEGIIEWTATSALSCGTEITITDGSPFSASIGNVTDDNQFQLSATGDQILAYQGADISPTFIYAINFDGTGWSNATTASTSALPTGLTNGTNAVNLGEIDNANYNCASVSGQSAILAGVSSSVNWILDNNRLASLGGCTYTCGTCVSTVTWNGTTWSATPDLTTEAIINGDYDSSIDGDLSACSLTVNTGFRLTVGNNSFVEIENDVVVDGELFVETSGNFVQNDALGTFTVNAGGLARVNKQTPPKDQWYYYTYWSSPVVNETIGSVFPDVDGDRRFWFNAANFIDNNGDDIDDFGNDWQYALAGATMTPGVGYAVTEARLFPSGLGASGTASFEGEFNTSDVPVTITSNPANTGTKWNLIGNPYPSAVNFVDFHTANSTVIDGAAYFWSQATPPDAGNSGNQQINFSKNDYAIYTVGSGAIQNDAFGNPPNGFIPSGQSFFIAGLTDGTVTFTNAMREKNALSNSQFFKNSTTKNNSTTFNRLWVNLTSNNGVFNQILVAYVDGATNAKDALAYDAPRLSINDLPAALYTSIEGIDTKFAIQGKATTSLNEDEVIKLGFATNINVETTYTLTLAQFEGDFLTNNPVYLKDNLLNKVHNLSASDYTFTSDVGEFNSRFEVLFSQASLSTDEFALNSKSLKIVELEDDRVQFTTTEDLSIKNINIYDLLGRQLYTFKGNSDSEIYSLSNISNSIYIAKVELSNGAVITKKAIKK
ncbi:T9SS type A sorting domain-containing protein [Litoribaculum gwangyangense]|uniref:T9SS C-terminal target domain-containing protein n=1 Tax=Litoribaculum gwangyangense TaxID=1130722 RepID=A0ABP9C1G1_9FLAO